ncbi:hypothetical protein COHA_002071 [Chlorella ohadii]|uniref:Tyrosine-specific transport protein n=1 Tax=Chlorella ohadii TaxID=2649997 RepID=A0AAD5DXM5_9CHLO|nr:hypothetical protein COHA_002071 [Chlorella ohadii]
MEAPEQPAQATTLPPSARPSRLFSNLNPSSLKHEPGSVLGAAALVAGTAVGAGILAIPAITAESGFAASSVALVGGWAFSVATGLLIAEVNINLLCEVGAGRGVSISSMAQRTLGDAGSSIVSLCYAGLHYALLVAYIAKAGEIVQQLTGVPEWAADAAFAALFGGLCFSARAKTLDTVNSVLVAAVVATFLGLVGVAVTDLRPEQLATANWGAVPDTLPVIMLSFVFHNIVGTIATSLEGDVQKIRQAIILGSGVPLLMFLAWDAAVLGSSGEELLLQAGTAAGADPLAALRATGGALVAPLIDAFSFLAVATSFIGFILGLNDFWSDRLQLPTGARQPLPYLLTLGPPLLLALSLGPAVFLDALDFAGTYGVLVLFGLIPVAMVWSERYARPPTTLSRTEIVPGGQLVLLAVGGSAAAIIGRELLLSITQRL